jgi:enoyl-CoA hydratase
MSKVTIDRRGSALWARLNRPESMNAIDDGILDGLDAALTEAETDSTVRTFVLTGNGRAFCAGADLNFVSRLDGGLTDFLDDVRRTMQRLEHLELPSIAAVNGTVFAGGLELLLCCDLAVAAQDAPISDAHANYGLLPGGGGSVRLPRRVGPTWAKYLMFTGRVVAARDLVSTALFNAVVSREELESTVDELTDTIAAKSPLAVSRMKQLLNNALDQPMHVSLKAELEASRVHSQSRDMAEGLAAFRQRRQPRFTGR